MNSAKPPIFRTPDKNHILAAPPTIQLEITSGCNQKCRHCYNFWRTDGYKKTENMTIEQMDFLIDEFVKNKVMHVVLTGGEPFLNFETLVHGIKRLTENRISCSVNSNLIMATPEKIKRLKEAGLPHILTSLDACNSETNDFLTSAPGSFERIINGIKTTLDGGIRVSINMIISKYNVDQIYETAKLARKLGCQKFNTTRTIPVLAADLPSQQDYVIDKEIGKKILDETLKVQKDMDFDTVSTMIPYPYCFLDDLDKYGIFMEKCSCVAGTKIMSINVNGDAHACVHESKSYGNVFKDGLKKAWEGLRDWQEGKMFPESCRNCFLFDECIAGCRMAARAYNKIDGDDNLKVGSGHMTKAIPVKPTKEMYDSVRKNKFAVVPSLRFRKENNFYLVTTFGARAVLAENNVVDFLNKFKDREFTLKDCEKDGMENAREIMAYSLFYNLIETAEDAKKNAAKRVTEFRNDPESKAGNNISPNKLGNEKGSDKKKDDLKKEAEAFDRQTDERIKAGFIPDLRRLKKVDWFYNNVWRDPEFVKIYLMPKINFVIDTAKQKKGRVLELGCGYGYLSLELARNGMDVVGVDLSPKSIKIAERFAKKNTFTESFGSLKYECADIMSMNFEPESFDSIVFFSTLHHMPDINLLFPKLKAALKKGGNLLIVEPLRGEFTKKNAEYAALIRMVAQFFISHDEKIEILNKKNWEEYVQGVFDEYTFKGEHEQSPNDNLTNNAKVILEATNKYFRVENVQYSDAFMEKIIGGLRGKEKYETARLLKALDDKLVREKVLPFTNIQIHAVKE